MSVAQFSFKSDVIGDLSFEVGDIIYIINEVDDLWFLGTSARNRHISNGIFPKSFVKLIDKNVISVYDVLPLIPKLPN